MPKPHPEILTELLWGGIDPPREAPPREAAKEAAGRGLNLHPWSLGTPQPGSRQPDAAPSVSQEYAQVQGISACSCTHTCVSAHRALHVCTPTHVCLHTRV